MSSLRNITCSWYCFQMAAWHPAETAIPAFSAAYINGHRRELPAVEISKAAGGRCITCFRVMPERDVRDVDSLCAVPEEIKFRPHGYVDTLSE